MEKVRVEVDAVKTRWQDMLVREQDAFFSDLRQRAAKQLYATARKALSDLADADLEERIVDEFLRRIQALDEEKSMQMRKAISGGGNLVTIQSAFTIPAPRQTQIEDVLKKQITNGFKVRYLLEPELIAQQGAAARRLAEERFDARRVVAEMLSVLPLPENALPPVAPAAPADAPSNNTASGGATQ